MSSPPICVARRANQLAEVLRVGGAREGAEVAPRQQRKLVEVAAGLDQRHLLAQRRLLDERAGLEQAREVEQRDRLGRIVPGGERRLDQREMAAEPARLTLRLEGHQLLARGRVVADAVGERAGVGVLELRRDGPDRDGVGDRFRIAAAEEVEDQRARVAFVGPGFGENLGEGTGGAQDRPGMCRLRDLVAAGDLVLQRLQRAHRLVGLRLVRAHRRRLHHEESEESGGDPPHGVASLTRISMRRLSGLAGSTPGRATRSA